MSKKESFLIYKSFYPPIKTLSNEQLGRLFRAIFEYQINNEEYVEDDLRMAFEFFKNQFRLDALKYENKVIANKSNGSKGGRPKTETNPNNPVGFLKPKKADNDNDNDKEKDKDNDKVFTPPILTDVVSYFLENGYTEDSGRRAFNYYDSSNWVDSKGKKVKLWKQKMIAVWFKPENKIPIKVEPERDEFGFIKKKSVMHT